MKLRLGAEVARAQRRRRPIVALETSVVAQGLPWPHNLAAARACEAAVREEGATPASIAVLDGQAWVGLSDAQLLELGEAKQGLMKVGSRDLAEAVCARRSGGTTVSATCELAAAAGIRVFATGGIGGVHRGVAEHLDVSQDLGALARFPVAVVCAGAKSILDLPKTLELLEALAVPVYGVGTDELPGFFTRSTGLVLEHQVADATEAARRAHVRLVELGQMGMIFAVPPPEHAALPAAEIEAYLEGALRAADRQGVSGKRLTPFLLAWLVERSQGRTLSANLALLENNARFAARLAVALGRLRTAAPLRRGPARSTTAAAAPRSSRRARGR